MNIQPSVVLWTVICFLLLMAVLKHLLFRPVLQILDERKKQLSDAREKKAALLQQLEEDKRRREEQEAAQAQIKLANTQAALEELRTKEKTALKDAHRECLLRIETYKEQSEKELDEILSAVTPEMKKVAELFAERITSDRD